MHDLYEFREGLEPSQSLLPCPLRSYLDPVKGKEAKAPSCRVTGAQWAYTARHSDFGFLYGPKRA